jgi:hypothetical protein
MVPGSVAALPQLSCCPYSPQNALHFGGRTRAWFLFRSMSVAHSPGDFIALRPLSLLREVNVPEERYQGGVVEP